MVSITRAGNGILFDTSSMTGSGIDFSKKFFIPIVAIESIALYSDRVVGKDSLGTDWNMTITGVNNSYPISTVGGVTVTTVDEIYNEVLNMVSV